MVKKSGMTMAGLGMMAIGVLVLIVAFTIIPIVGDQLDTSITLGATSQWNSSVNTAVPTGVDLWESTGGILKVGAIIVVVAGFLTTLKGLRG